VLRLVLGRQRRQENHADALGLEHLPTQRVIEPRFHVLIDLDQPSLFDGGFPRDLRERTIRIGADLANPLALAREVGAIQKRQRHQLVDRHLRRRVREVVIEPERPRLQGACHHERNPPQRPDAR